MTTVNDTTLSCIEINPVGSPQVSIIWLHGLGADGNDFAPAVQELDLPPDFGCRFVFPHAPFRPVTINQGYTMRAWYDIISMKIDQQMDQDGMNESIKLVEALIEKEVRSGIPYEKIILAGFSQGAVMALLSALTYPKKLGGVIALSGYLPLTQLPPNSSANQHTPIFLAHGTQDPVVPYMLGLNAYETLKKWQYPIDWHTYTMGHSVCREEIQAIAAWLKQLIKNVSKTN